MNDRGVHDIFIHVHEQVKLFYYTTSRLIDKANDRGVHDISIHFQEQVC